MSGVFPIKRWIFRGSSSFSFSSSSSLPPSSALPPPRTRARACADFYPLFLHRILTYFQKRQELAQELGEAPEELGGDEGDMSSAFAKREFARMEARAKIEEDLFTRVPLSKVERRRQKATTRSMNSLAEVGDFGDDVADLVDVVEELEGQRGKRQRLVDVVSQGANPKQQKNKPVSGEQDVPLRDTLGVSIVKHRRQRALTPIPPSRLRSCENETPTTTCTRGGANAHPLYALFEASLTVLLWLFVVKINAT